MVNTSWQISRSIGWNLWTFQIMGGMLSGPGDFLLANSDITTRSSFSVKGDVLILRWSTI